MHTSLTCGSVPYCVGKRDRRGRLCTRTEPKLQLDFIKGMPFGKDCSYSTREEIRTINSQVNEQANSGLIRIQPQLAYMSPNNFMFHASLFLALRNMRVRDEQ
ncbi:hypothetical protein Bbelb_227560 [Branchiostoma belcheri]|nr:hypothetical protein Bbelb_227560 [Branchiostoma belcheri]